MPRFSLYNRLGVSDNFDPAHKFVTSPILRSPLVFVAFRITVALFTLVTLLFTLIWKTVKLHEGKSYFSYFTYLTYIGVCSYYCAASTQTVAYALRWRKSGAGAGYPLQRWPKLLQALHVILQSTVITFPILVTIVFWSLLTDPETFSTSFSRYSNISVHALNTLFALFEIFFTNSPPPPWIALPFSTLFLLGYLCLAYVTHATQGFYTYSFLDPKLQGATLAAYIIGIPVGDAIIFSIVRGLMVLRERWALKTGRVIKWDENAVNDGWEGVGDASREGLGDDDWEEIQRPTGRSKESAA